MEHSGHDEARPRFVLVTGASRGIGAETARRLAASGCHVAINYREKRRRADALVVAIEVSGGRAFAFRADLVDEQQTCEMVGGIGRLTGVGGLDAVVLNASGGMERDVDAGYAMRLNRDAQVRLLEQCRGLLGAQSRVVLVTSHQAHFLPQRPVPPVYQPVAESKRAGEDAIRRWCASHGVDLAVVSGDMIEGTITVALLERKSPGTIAGRLNATGAIPTIGEFASAIADTVLGPLPEATVYVGGLDYLGQPTPSTAT